MSLNSATKSTNPPTSGYGEPINASAIISGTPPTPAKATTGVPTAAARVCTTDEEAAAALDELGAPYVVKDDGLAAGKGVVVTDDRDAAVGCHALHLG